jgi:hypothetical protein
LVAALLMATHTALTANDANLHLKLQHGFHDAQVSLWVDGDLAYSGKITSAPKKKFGLIPTDSVRGSLSQIILVRSGSIVSLCGSKPTTPTTPRCRKTASAGTLRITRSGTSLFPLGPVLSLSWQADSQHPIRRWSEGASQHRCLHVHLQADVAPFLKNGGPHDGCGLRANPRRSRCGLEYDRNKIFPPLSTSGLR